MALNTLPINPNHIDWSTLGDKAAAQLTERLVQHLLGRFGPDTTLGDLQAALTYQKAVDPDHLEES